MGIRAREQKRGASAMARSCTLLCVLAVFAVIGASADRDGEDVDGEVVMLSEESTDLKDNFNIQPVEDAKDNKVKKIEADAAKEKEALKQKEEQKQQAVSAAEKKIEEKAAAAKKKVEEEAK